MSRPNIDELEEWYQVLSDNDSRTICSLIDYIKELEKKREWNWNQELHNQYLASLDERDALQAQIDELEAKANRLENIFNLIKKLRTERQIGS